MGNVLIFFDVDGDGSPDGNATTNSAGAFSFTPTTPDNEGFVQVDAWLARGGSPSDSNSRTFRFVYSSAPNDSGAQALVTELATFDSAWQNANTTLEQGIAAAKNALKSSLQTADATYRQEMSTAMGCINRPVCRRLQPIEINYEQQSFSLAHRSVRLKRPS